MTRAQLGVSDWTEQPLVVVDLDAPCALSVSAVDTAAIVAESTPGFVVGVTGRALDPALDPLVEALDFTFSDVEQDDRRVVVRTSSTDDAVQQVQSAAMSRPLAAAALSDLLRMTSVLPVPAALRAESFAYSTLLSGPEFRGWLSARRARSDRSEPPRPTVRMELSGSTLHLTLDWPEKRNAYGRAMRDGLVDALTLVDLDQSITAVELRGEGPAFCSGGDLDEFGSTPDPATANIIRITRSAGALMHRCRERVQVWVHGACIGAGVELPAFAGRISAAPGTFFALPEVAMGLVPGAGGTASITRRIGRWRTAYLALSGVSLDVATALDWGLIDAIEPDR